MAEEGQDRKADDEGAQEEQAPSVTQDTPEASAELKAEKEAEKTETKEEIRQKTKGALGGLKLDLVLGQFISSAIEGLDKFLSLITWDKGNWESMESDSDSTDDSTQEQETSSSRSSVPKKVENGFVKQTSKKERKTMSEKANPSAKKALEKTLKEHPDWKGYVKEAEDKFNVPSHIIFAIMYLESGFKATAKNKYSGAAGLGQFIPSTWKSFLSANPEFAGMNQFDPRASIFATAWYCRQNADHLGIDMNADDAAARIYEAHHNGEGGYRTMEAFRAGRISSFKVPKSYAEHGYDTPQKYTDHIIRLANGVQANADSFETLLA